MIRFLTRAQVRFQVGIVLYPDPISNLSASQIESVKTRPNSTQLAV